MIVKSPLLSLLKNSLPWIIALSLLYYLFQKYPIEDVLRAFRHTNIFFFIAYSTLYFLFIWVTDCWTLSWIFLRSGHPINTKDVLIARLASYSFTLFHYGATQGALAYFFKKKRILPFFKSSSIILFVMMIDFYLTVTLSFVGTFFARPTISGNDLSPFVQGAWILVTLTLSLLLFFRKFLLKLPLPTWTKSRDLLYAIEKIRFRDYGNLLLMRFPMHLIIHSSLFFVALTFGITLPFAKILTSLPIIGLLGSIPITPAGLGTTQLATIEFLKDQFKGDVPLLLSMSFSFVFFNHLLKIILGLFSFKALTKKVVN